MAYEEWPKLADKSGIGMWLYGITYGVALPSMITTLISGYFVARGLTRAPLPLDRAAVKLYGAGFIASLAACFVAQLFTRSGWYGDSWRKKWRGLNSIASRLRWSQMQATHDTYVPTSSGTFWLQLPSDLQEKLAREAKLHNKSLNEYVLDVLNSIHKR